MARTQTLVQLSEELVAALDVVAGRRGVSRSRVIREAVSAYLADLREERVTAALIAGYQSVPQGGGDEWGSLDEFRGDTRRRMLERLDQEKPTDGEDW
jgi:predicted transcriptional regulator